ncbi:MAG: hypothetical protein EOQ30_19960 [Mesorhizobium sp.]|nr:MAG: hypothetical protein EOQ30_19960 [Mesorhizobium sp.]
MARVPLVSGVGAAPHPPAGILSPYSDGERDAVAVDFANRKRRRKKRRGCGQLPSPVTIRGGGAGRRMWGRAYL